MAFPTVVEQLTRIVIVKYTSPRFLVGSKFLQVFDLILTTRSIVWGVYMVYENMFKSENDLNLTVVTVSPSQKNFVPEIHLMSSFVISRNSWGYFCFIKSSRSHVYSGPRFEFQRTFTIGILLSLSCFTSLSRISIGSLMKFNFSSILISFRGTTNDSSSKHFFRFQTWNVSWIALNSRGNLNLYVTGPILRTTSNGPTYLGLSFLFF